MSTVSSKKAISSDVLALVVEGVDVQKLDAFLDALFDLAATWKTITCSLIGDHALCVRSNEAVIQEAEVPRAKSTLRMACARLAVRCGEWAGRQVSPYGETVEVEHPKIKRRCSIHFENTAGTQELHIDANV
jgi:hypothetical protein